MIDDETTKLIVLRGEHDPEDEATLLELARREAEMDEHPVPFSCDAEGGRWSVAFEWHGGLVLTSKRSLSRARRLVKTARQHGAKWAFFGRRRRGGLMLHRALWGPR